MRDFIESKSSYIYVFLLSGIFLFIGCFFILSSSLEVVRYNNQLNLQSNISVTDNISKFDEFNEITSKRVINKETFIKIPRKIFDSNYDNKNVLLNNHQNRHNLPNINLHSFYSDYFPEKFNPKKEKFISGILPFIIEQNKNIQTQRLKLLKIEKYININKTLSKNDQNFVSNLAKEYNVDTKNKHKIDIIKTLLFSVDIIPNSIVIAQAANESGWGTSRFATEYNALFGEYTFNDSNGVVPNLREKGQTHLVKFFPSVNESIKSYFKNINTHTAYNDFRLERRKLRVNNSLLDANILVNYLNTYAIDKNYVRTLQLIIRDNKLLNFDNIIITTKS